MEGFSLQKGSGSNFISTFEGNFVTKVPEGTEGAVARKNKNGITVHELHFNTFVGLVTSIVKKDSDYGFQWEIGLFADKPYVLNLPFSGGMTVSLFTRMVNTDLSKKVLIGILNSKGTDDKMRTFFWMYSNPRFEGGKWVGEKVLPFWSKENKNGLPQMVKVKIKGKDAWDDTEQMEYIENYLAEHIVPTLPKAPESVQDGPPDDEDEPQEQPKPEIKKAPLPGWMQNKKETLATPPPSNKNKKGGKSTFESPSNQDLGPDGKPWGKETSTDDLPFNHWPIQ